MAIFVFFLKAKMVNLGPIDFQLGWPLNIIGNDGQNKFEVHISKIVAKMAYIRPTIGHDAISVPTLNGLTRRDKSNAVKS